MRIVLFILSISGFIACSSNNEMTIDDLEKASWEDLPNGMGHIKLAESRSKKSDSVQYIFIGIGPEKRFPQTPEQFEFNSRWVNKILPPITNSYLPDSDSGYLRIAEYHILGNPARTMTIFLEEDYDSTRVSKYTQSLRAIAGVDNVTYISSAMAKEELLKDATPHFKKMIENEKPQPATFKLLISKKNATDEGMKAIFKQINPAIGDVQDIQYPDPSVTDKMMYIKYRRY